MSRLLILLLLIGILYVLYCYQQKKDIEVDKKNNDNPPGNNIKNEHLVNKIKEKEYTDNKKVNKKDKKLDKKIDNKKHKKKKKEIHEEIHEEIIDNISLDSKNMSMEGNSDNGSMDQDNIYKQDSLMESEDDSLSFLDE
ncbi:MAG: hypothetical protein Edafosvirus12_19 [Edafosvirus sp.]|uniref:Uncharacterized protein n=1 Tax=Edafosvirus sp. TaxID=2487765 RepID=A0A3G4ZU41_9VIRU|nr:MAG: hypothetical protein Edafosvirus12_19 [Edafosvirus sp.]